MLGELGEAEREAAGHETPRRRRVHEAVEEAQREEGEGGEADVDRGQVGVGDQRRAEDGEEERHQGRLVAVELAGPAEDEGGEEKAERHDRQAPPEEEAVVERPVARHEVGAELPREPAGVENGAPRVERRVEREERQRAEQLDQRRVQGEEVETAGLQVVIAGGQVRELVDRRRVPAQAVRREQGEESEEEDGGQPGLATQGRLKEIPAEPAGHSSSNSGLPVSTACPGCTWSRAIVPSCSARISFSIFIASRTTIPWPAVTSAPSSTRTATTRPGM